MRGDRPPNDLTNRIISRRHAEKDLRRSGVILRQPAFQALTGRGISVLERLEQSHRRLVTLIADALMQRETHGEDELPERQREAEKRERRQDDVQPHAGLLTGRRGGRQTFLRRPRWV